VSGLREAVEPFSGTLLAIARELPGGLLGHFQAGDRLVDLVGLQKGAVAYPQRDRRMPKIVDAQPGRPAAIVAGRQMRLRNAVTRSGPPAGEVIAHPTVSPGQIAAIRCAIGELLAGLLPRRRLRPGP
jgi:hypothetical protein